MKKAEKIKELIAEMIQSFNKRGLNRLPTERSLSVKFGVSRDTVVKALTSLEMDGYVERRQGSGTYIVDSSAHKDITIGLVFEIPFHKAQAQSDLIYRGLSFWAETLGVKLQAFESVREELKQPIDTIPVMKATTAGLLDGILVCTRLSAGIAAALSAKLPLIMLGHDLSQGRVTSVVSDHFRTGFIGACHFLSSGHRRIAYISDYLKHPVAYAHLSGARCAMELENLTISDDDCLETLVNAETFIKNVESFFAKGNHTAALVRHDVTASQLIRTLKKIGKRVPEDISVIGVGNYNSGFNSELELTSIDSGYSQMCEIALKNIVAKVKRIRGENVELPFGNSQLYTVEPKLVPGETVRNLCETTTEKCCS
jgi:GntR family transcriptional regulator of arabinose operon